ncbi:hypothetical protein JCGZ_07630 [Jatropha curcas]|uniref:C2 NT-type domain-containing protein n=1 Tax=Jatropha curcas TaxID=180498 RepID=A0A067KQF6_JATCU|nr:protein PLASTID MOVEMENT IMPAIRED 1-RELATED 2 [Jatropha curcas]XP_020536406.1 protein PLASTID MOVEMENT IMPAIRED 1-RELATED 2 [Jatropha curcas]KDP34059.1 hypothetical protein JCGZ_07630 [Jatropha curcas]
MMLSKIGSTNSDGDGNSNNGQLLRDIEAISQALYLQKAPRKALISSSSARSKSAERPRLSESKSSLNPRTYDANVSIKDKKSSSSVWNWKKPLKALAHIRHQKFNVCFFLHVHSIEGLPSSFDDMKLSVNWKRKDELLQTRPSRVLKGIVEFDETLMHTCCVYGSRSGTHHSAKYEVKLFSIYVSVIGALGVDMGKQWVDLTRLLPLTLEELEGEKSTGKWTTSFKLAGKAMGATLNVSLGFHILRDSLIETARNMNVLELVNMVHGRSCTVEQITGVRQTNSNEMLQRVGSVPSHLNQSHLSSQSVNVKICDEISPNLGLELSKSISFLYQKLDEANLHNSEEFHAFSEHLQPLKLKPDLELESDKDIGGNEYYCTEFTVIEKGIEMSEKEDLKSEESNVQFVDALEIETVDVNEIIKDDDIELDGKTKFHSKDSVSSNCLDGVLVDDCKHEISSICKKGSSMEDLELAFNRFFTSESTELESPLAKSEILQQENYMDTKVSYKAHNAVNKYLSLDEVTESVASDFLNMLGIEHSPFGSSSDCDPESPRERLLREFEEEAIASGNFIVEYDGHGKHEEFGCIASLASDCGDLSADFDLCVAIQAAEEEHQRENQLLSRRKAKLLEDLETEALMNQWGLNEEAFQSSPRYCSDGFGSPVELLPEEPVELPPLGDGFGPFVQTKDGGYLRSMNPSLFKTSKNVGSLIMQVSRPVVLPVEMGSDIIEILQHLASIGIERLSQQANKLMPLEDITGKTLHQIAQDTTPGVAVPVRRAPSCPESLLGKEAILHVEMGSDYVTLENLAPLAVDKIETMSIEGLKIQSGMAEEEAPSSVFPQSFEGKSASLSWFLSMEGVAELQELDGRDVDGLFDLSITLEEWLRLDGGVIGNEDQVSERTLKILAAHHARCMDLVNGKLTRENYWNKAAGRKQGLLGNNLTVAQMVLLRDPFRNYEPVGASMLAIVQVERSFFCLKPIANGTVLERRSNEEEDTNDNILEEEETSIGFKITEVHLSGLNAEPGKKQHWGTKTQQQYGIRWLLASGMSKSSKHPFSKSKAMVVSSPHLLRKMQNNDCLWSISSQASSPESKWKELTGFVPHIRNPNVIFSK